MSGKMSAAWWREYRARRGESLRAYNRTRRHRPDIRAQRHASEERRRARIRDAQPADVPIAHPMLDAAAALIPEVSARGIALRLPGELLVEEMRAEAVLAMVEGRDPVSAVRACRAVERAWQRVTCPLLTEPAA